MNRFASILLAVFLIATSLTISSCGGGDELPDAVRPNVPEIFIGTWLQPDLLSYGIIDGWEFEEDNIYKINGSIRSSIVAVAESIEEEIGNFTYEIRVSRVDGAMETLYCFWRVNPTRLQQRCVLPADPITFIKQ